MIVLPIKETPVPWLHALAFWHISILATSTYYACIKNCLDMINGYTFMFCTTFPDLKAYRNCVGARMSSAPPLCTPSPPAGYLGELSSLICHWTLFIEYINGFAVPAHAQTVFHCCRTSCLILPPLTDVLRSIMGSETEHMVHILFRCSFDMLGGTPKSLWSLGGQRACNISM
jgi:hypothetical protein